VGGSFGVIFAAWAVKMGWKYLPYLPAEAELVAEMA